MALKQLAVVAVAVAMLAATAAAQVDCTHTTVDVDTGNVLRFLNLSQIAPVNQNQDLSVEDSLNPNYVIYFRICDKLRNPSVCPTTIDNSSVCQVSNPGPRYDSLGVRDSIKILDFPASDHSRGVFIEYSDGSPCGDGNKARRTFITAECDPTSSEPVSGIVAYNHPEGAPEPCEYTIYLTSRYACPEVGAGSCSAVTDCASCGQVPGCGWCSLSQRCVAGSVEGPNTGSCYGPYWHYDEASNPCVRCESIGGCTQCSSQPDCKFCSASGGCQGITSINCLEPKTCTCPTCGSGSYCPDEGGSCVSFPNTAGLFVGGMFLSFGLVGIAGAIYYFWNKRKTTYTGLA